MTIENGTKMVMNDTVTVTVDSYAKGWYTVSDESGHEFKARAKQLAPVETVLLETGADEVKMRCSECGHKWVANIMTDKVLNVRCPECGAWNNVRLNPDLDHYIRGLDTTAGGHSTLDIGDASADLLRGYSPSEMFSVAGSFIFNCGQEFLSKALTKELKDVAWNPEALASYFAKKYVRLNNGMQRMNMGNIVRGMYKRMKEAEDSK